MLDLYPLIRPLLFKLPAEGAHDFALKALESGLWRLIAAGGTSAPPELRQQLWGLHFANPVGLAAGFDKDARVPQAMLRLGFGFVEIGTVTPRPQSGNQKPRLFRLDEDRAVINRMGFNSGGLEAAIERLLALPRLPGVLGINLGKNRDSEDAASDYEEGLRRAAPLADFLVVNISSPNTPGLRDLQRRASLASLLGRLIAARAASGLRPPLLVKIAPDLSPEERANIAEVALESGIDGLVIGNTTLARPAGLKSAAAREAGGLSGRPLFAPSTALLAEMYRLTGGRLPLVGVGGVASAEDAYEKIRAGASLVELYTALVFEGPGLIRRITLGLARLLRRDGFTRLGEAVGSAADAAAQRSRSRAG
jgi:dihydroorotate dehydrogenase